MKKTFGCVFFIAISLPALVIAEQAIHHEEIRITDFANYTRIEYRFDNKLLAAHFRVLAPRGQFSEDRLMVFPRSGNGIFYTISINPNGRLNSVSAGGNIRNCSEPENIMFCATMRDIAVRWYQKLGVNRAPDCNIPPSYDWLEYLPMVP